MRECLIEWVRVGGGPLIYEWTNWRFFFRSIQVNLQFFQIAFPSYHGGVGGVNVKCH